MRTPRKRARGRRLNLKRTLFLLPNLLTLSSVFCGFSAMVLVSTAHTDQNDFHRAALLITFAMFFDILDGRVARMTKTQSAFGLQIDSLADVVSFGAAPGLLIYHWALSALDNWGVFASFVYVACGAVRLARFNVLASDPSGAPTKPGKYIVGLPIPGAAGVLVALVVASTHVGGVEMAREHSGAIAAVMMGLGGLMVSTVRFRSFKELKLNLTTGLVVLFVVGSSALIMARMEPAFVLLWLLTFYLGLGIVEFLIAVPRRFQRSAVVDEVSHQEGSQS
jgi:CDP-diacylglycerol--serine O-phosphatidyltransferase